MPTVEASLNCSRGAQEAGVSTILTSITVRAARKNVAIAVTSVEVVAAVEAQVRHHHARSDGHGSNILLVILDSAEESAPAVLVVSAGAALAR
jgi:pantothenate kinase type III